MGGIRTKYSRKSRRISSSVYAKMGGCGRGGTLDCIRLSPFLRHASSPDGGRASGKTVAYPYNRTPLIDGPTKATVQDGGICRVACVLYNRTEFVTAFEAIGYEVVDSWKAWELSLKIVGKPESSAVPYSGFFFRLKGQAPKRGGIKTGPRADANDK
jgi:hypothetical protein